MSNLEYHLRGNNSSHDFLFGRRFLVTIDYERNLFLYLQSNGPQNGQINGCPIVGGGKMNIAVNQKWDFSGSRPKQVNSDGYFIHFYGADETFGPVPVEVADHFADLISQELKGRNVTRKVIRPNVLNGSYNPLWEELGFDPETQKPAERGVA